LLGESQFDPFCTYRLAEIHNNFNNFEVEVNKEKSWFYILKSCVIIHIKYNTDFFNVKEKLMTSMAKDGFDKESCYSLIHKY
jgi:hypothetical protein